MIEFRPGYTEALGDMVYDVFVESPHLITSPYYLASREESKQRLRDLHEWVIGAYYGDEPVAAMWGKDNEIQWVANSKYRKRWITKGLMKQFLSWFYSKYDTMKAKPKNENIRKMLVKFGFTGGDIMERGNV